MHASGRALGPRADASVKRRTEDEPGDAVWRGEAVSFAIDGGLRWAVGLAAPEAAFLAGADAATARAAGWGVLMLLGAGVAGLVLAAGVARPLLRLAEVTRGVGRFELAEAAERPSWCREVNVMSRAVGDTKRSLRSFARFVPGEVVRRVVADGGRAEPGGEQRELTVFFCDVAGFTTLSETLAPDALVRVMGVYLDAVVQDLLRTGGTVDKFIGDAVLGFWNAPRPVPDHALCGVRAALAVRDAVAGLVARGRAADAGDAEAAALRHLGSRIGVAGGRATVGNVGTAARLNYTALGPPVTRAETLEGRSKTEGTTLLVDGPTRRACGDAVVFRAVDAPGGRRSGRRTATPWTPTRPFSPTRRCTSRCARPRRARRPCGRGRRPATRRCARTRRATARRRRPTGRRPGRCVPTIR